MKKLLLKIFIAMALIFLLEISTYADSPITSTTISNAYADVSIVSKAISKKVLDDDILKYMSKEENPIDVKAAIISSFILENSDNLTETYTAYIKKDINSIDLKELTANQLFCIGYLKTADLINKHMPATEAVAYLKAARQKDKKSLTIALIDAVVEAQASKFNPEKTDSNWKMIEVVLYDKSLIRDLRPEAISIIFDYMRLYSKSPVVNPFDINIDPSSIHLYVGMKTNANIQGGIAPYTATNVSFARIEINNEVLTVYADKEGSGEITISDSSGLKKSLKIYCDVNLKQDINLRFKVDSSMFNVNGTNLEIDSGRDTKPIILNGRTILPIRKFIETIGGKVQWNEKENKILIEKESIVIELVLNSNEAVINNEKKELEVAPQIINGRTYMPLRFISENLGGKVLWDNDSKTISIKIGGKLNINNSDANSPGNIVNGKIAYYYNGYLYYQNGNIDGALYKMNLADGKKERLIGGIPIDFVIYDGWVYYSDIGDHLAIYKVSIDGGSRISVKNLTGRYFNLVGENLIFQNMNSYGQIYKLNLNNESLVKMDNINHPSPITSDEEWIYYTYGGDIYKLKISNNEKKIIKKGNAFGGFYLNGYYFYKSNGSEGYLYKIDSEGKNNSIVFNEQILDFNIQGNLIYYFSTKTQFKVHTYNIDTGEDITMGIEEGGDLNICAGILINNNKSIKP